MKHVAVSFLAPPPRCFTSWHGHAFTGMTMRAILYRMNIRRPTDLRKKRDKQDVRKKYFIAVAGVVFLSLTGLALLAVKQSDFFTVRAVEVSGVPAVYGEQVLRDMKAFSREHSLLFRFLGADNMLAWSGDPDEFLDANPQFKTLRVQKDPVHRAIKIVIDVREKFGVWCGAGSGDDVRFIVDEGTATATESGVTVSDTMGECYWFDRDGVLFAKAPQVQSELFNRVQDSTGRALVLRDKILPDRLFVNMVKIFALLEVADINTKTVFLRDLELEEVFVDSVSDPTLYFSLHESPDFALSAIDAIKKSGGWGGLGYVDLRSENRAYYR